MENDGRQCLVTFRYKPKGYRHRGIIRKIAGLLPNVCGMLNEMKLVLLL